MDRSTLLALNRINREFYRQQAQSFNRSRKRPWSGWSRLLARPVLHNGGEPLSVMDVGCGNGRFGVYLGDHLERSMVYVGVDASPELLSEARQSLTGAQAGVGVGAEADAAVYLVEHDLIASLANQEMPEVFARAHDLVVVFGLLHHIPSAAARSDLVRWCAQALDRGGVLALTCWQFGARERFSNKLVPWEQVAAKYGVALSELEPGDCLLRWGTTGALRYCHFIQEAEMNTWVNLPRLRAVDRFIADGQSNDLNAYLILERA